MAHRHPVIATLVRQVQAQGVPALRVQGVDHFALGGLVHAALDHAVLLDGAGP